MVTAIYGRVSTAKQEEFGASLETQKEKIAAYCTIKDFKNVREYVDVGTGRNTDRTDFQRMMRDIEAGKISNVVVFRLDRLTRSVSDLDKLLKKFKAHNCSLHSATESLDTSTANGRMMVNIIATFAQWESETISERVTVNMDSLAEKGVWMGVVPYGFYLGEDKRLKLKEDEASILREAFDLVLSGESMISAEKTISNKYNVSWSHNFLRRKVRQASTVGDIKRKGRLIKNTHKGIITKEEQAKIIDILVNNRTGRRYLKNNDIFRRRIICYQCNSIMILNTTTDKRSNTTRHSYACDKCYTNGRGHISVAEKVIERALEDYMSHLKLDNFKDDVDHTDNQKMIVNLNAKLKRLDKKRDKIQRAWIEDKMSDDDLDRYKKEIDDEENETLEKLSNLSPTKSISTDQIQEVQEYFTTLFNNLTQDEKRIFVQQHIKEIHFERELMKDYQKRYNVTIKNVIFF